MSLVVTAVALVAAALIHAAAFLAPLGGRATAVLVPLALFAWTLPLDLILQLVLAVVLPILVGLVTTRVTSAGRKAVLLLALSIVTSFVTELLASIGVAPFDVGLWLIKAVGTFATGVALHYGLFKPSGISAAIADSGVKPRRALLEVDPDSPIPGTVENFEPEDGSTTIRGTELRDPGRTP